MRGLWQCSGCVGLLVLGASTQMASANRENDGEYEVLWIEKSLNILQHVKRKDVCQKDGWSLCPSSVGGGCCPDYFECDTASCYATTAGPTSCGGKTGWYNCPATLGAGSCCEVGLICNDSGNCNAPPGESMSQSCPPDWFGCPVSLGGGCCRNGLVCGTGVCYNTTPNTLPVSETKTTTDSRGHTTITVVTSLVVITDGPNTSSGSPTVVEVPQLIPSTVAKVDAIQTSDSGEGGGGLSSGALGGIVTGAIVILVAIIIAATFIVWRLKKAEKAARDAEKAAESRHESDSEPRSHKSGFGQPTVSEIDSTTDVDPLHRFPIMLPSPHLRSRSATNATTDRSPSRTPNFTNSGTSSPPLWATSFNCASSITSDGRQSSLDSYPRHDSGTVRMSQRVSEDSRIPFGHGRQPSDTSELEGPHGVSEIYTIENSEAEPQRRSDSITRPAKAHSRKNSDVSGQNRARGDSNAGAGALGTVNEMFELHGHYGPPYTAAGQTAANPDRGPSTTPSN
ncbi:hypothetical protein FHL15_009273 [Xylaria flabelliformis]|uniref:Mid2 domain-containing protein n=1 Tax=Xylaria flabelliformis TaxID=2512241 RepID=A0A553HPH8_9PEZI|nr:hypothetical protein FHL15_009273 [Xylaria flabelliformis]